MVELLPGRRYRDRERGAGEAGDDEGAAARRAAARGRGPGLGRGAPRRQRPSGDRRFPRRARPGRRGSPTAPPGSSKRDVRHRRHLPSRRAQAGRSGAGRGDGRRRSPIAAPTAAASGPRPGVGLGHRRLSIIDLSDAAAQPMLAPDGRAGDHATMARSTISARCGRSLRRKGHRLPHRERHRGDPRRLAAMGPGLPRPASTACSPSRSTTPAEDSPVPRPRPARREAALLRRALRRRPDLRLGAQGPARPSRCCAARRARRRSRIISPTATSPTTPRSSRA